MRFRAVLTVALSALFLLIVGPFLADSSAGAYPVTTCSTLSVSTTNPLPGQAITVTGTNFQPNASVRLELRPHGDFLTTVTTDGNGSFSTQVTLPDGVEGNQNIVALTGSVSSSSCPADPIQTLAIQAESLNNGGGGNGNGAGGNGANGNGNGNGGLSVTGFDIAGLLALAAVLIGAGVTLNRKKTRVGSR